MGDIALGCDTLHGGATSHGNAAGAQMRQSKLVLALVSSDRPDYLQPRLFVT